MAVMRMVGSDVDAQVWVVNGAYAAENWSGGKTFSQCAMTGLQLDVGKLPASATPSMA